MSDEDWRAKGFEAMQLFSPAAPVDELDLFVGWSEQVTKMLEAVNERGKHAVLFRERGVGKTSLAKFFQSMFPRTARRILVVREQVDPSDDFSSIWWKVFKDMHVRCVDDANHTLTPLVREYPGIIQPDDVRREFQAIFTSNDIPIM